jgi:hypothetical protein
MIKFIENRNSTLIIGKSKQKISLVITTFNKDGKWYKYQSRVDTNITGHVGYTRIHFGITGKYNGWGTQITRSDDLSY